MENLSVLRGGNNRGRSSGARDQPCALCFLSAVERVGGEPKVSRSRIYFVTERAGADADQSMRLEGTLGNEISFYFEFLRLRVRFLLPSSPGTRLVRLGSGEEQRARKPKSFRKPTLTQQRQRAD